MQLFIIFLVAVVVSSCQTNKNSQSTTTNQVQQNSSPAIIYDLKDSVRINLSVFTRRDGISLTGHKMLKHADTVNYPSRGVESEMPRVRMFRSTLSLLDKYILPSMAKLTFYSEDNKEIKSESTSRLTTQEAELSSGCCTSGTSRDFVSEAYYAKITHYFSNKKMKDSVEVYIKF